MAEDKPYYLTACRFCAYRIAHPAFELVDLAALNGRPPRRLEEFRGKLIGHIQRCAEDEDAQIQEVMRRHQKRQKKGGDSPPPDLSVAKHHQAWLTCLNRVILAESTGILSAFTSTDPALNAMQNSARWNLHQATRKFYFTDQLLLDRLQALSLSPADQAAVFQLVSEIRDVLVEQGEYMPGKEGAAIAEGAATAAAAIADGQPAG